MRYMVRYKCTYAERDGRPHVGSEGMDCYMVSNQMFLTIEEARNYANGVASCRQPCVMEMIEYKCPVGGGWKKRWSGVS